MTTDQTGGVRGRHATLTGLSPQATVPWGLGWWLQGDSLPFALCDFASPRAFGAGGASGCQLLVDPDTRTVVVLLTNTHSRIGLELWAARLRSIVNLAYLEASHA
jgi:CubicO group peptidase (beta-lactamase class C family)